MTSYIIILIVFIILSAFFSAAEVAFVSLSHAKIETMVAKKLPKSLLIQRLKKNPRRLLVTILIGNNIVNIGSASIATVVANQYFDNGVIGITTGVMTLIVLIFGEIIPKSYASNHPQRFAMFASQFIRMLEWIGLPIIIVFEWMTNIFAGKQTADRISEEELRAMAAVSAKQGSIEKGEGKMIERLFAFNDITAEDIMTPRVNVFFLDHDITLAEAREKIEETGHTRFPVMRETPDTVIGYVHAKDILQLILDGRTEDSITNHLRSIVRLPKQLPIDDVLKEFQKEQSHIAIVLDEYGGTEGIVTLEDVIEELVGEIADEHDIDEHIMKRIDKYTIEVAGETELRDINDFLNTRIPGDQFDTISEIMLDELKKIPEEGMQVTFNNVTATVKETKGSTISLVLIHKGI